MVTADAAAARALTGAVLSRRWRLLQKVGDGGMGEVYAAEPVDGGARVAVKLLRPEFLGEPQVLSRFLEEGSLCSRLIHPNIARMLECATAEDGSPYLVMELLEGVPLGAYMQNGARIPLAQAVPILQGILGGLAAAHAQGVVHRDLKPDNVFLTRGPGGTFVVKVLDFGIAKVMDAAGGMGSRTRTGMLLGTPAYMSPEQVKSPKDVDARADLWSAGVMFYEMLTGRVAFPAPTEYARLAAVMTSEPEPIERVDPALAPVGPFVQRALRKNRDDRYPSALEMARALVAAVPQASSDAQGNALSRLPEVASAFGAQPGAPSTASMREGGPPQPIVVVSVADPLARPPGGTLASAAGRAVNDPPPQVVIVPPAASVGGTLPSKDLPVLGGPGSRGVAHWIVALLVAAALGAGFMLGWAFGHTP
jgi:eukaryotic-like serine/threonine-protein kinase